MKPWAPKLDGTFGGAKAMRNLTSNARLLGWLLAVACVSGLGACKKAKEVIVDAIGPEGSAKAGAATPAEGTPPVDFAQQANDPLVRKDFQQEVQGGDAGPAAAVAPTSTPAPTPTSTQKSFAATPTATTAAGRCSPTCTATCDCAGRPIAAAVAPSRCSPTCTATCDCAGRPIAPARGCSPTCTETCDCHGQPIAPKTQAEKDREKALLEKVEAAKKKAQEEKDKRDKAAAAKDAGAKWPAPAPTVAPAAGGKSW
jgi:hypothetical protein